MASSLSLPLAVLRLPASLCEHPRPQTTFATMKNEGQSGLSCAVTAPLGCTGRSYSRKAATTPLSLI
ncbi:hypothetical protein HNQ71_006471 [Mesorhizobium sangaii]|uniref:Uncharacterized protein n=1 Tax=Mesorhizobium sangaii TaxID=505389 RepID=A0A841PUP3_9HYPH|nr:hypothetical protein [Mesorhizobium sangaii]